ncbi:MAG: PTS sugar transporter subunit IIA [Candidatus Cloacimonetes bacterium]|nr:PTS sugar transporter subunit IIA [Candidatus Cloacimonadota bacterium]
MNEIIIHLQSWLSKEIVLIPHPTPLLVLAIILLTGFVFTRIARKIKLPSVTAQIIGGIILGHYVLNIFHEESYQGFIPITNFALGFIGLTIGSHLNFTKLHNAGKRILFITITDVIITPILVFLSLFYIANLSFEISLIISAIAITTAPGSTIHIVKEKRARGVFTKTLLAVVALNNVLTILLFYVAYYFLFYRNASSQIDILHTFTTTGFLFLESIIIGFVVGFTLIYFTEKRKTSVSFLTLIILAVVITVGTSETLHFSGILSSLILGMVITNFSKKKKTFFNAFKDLEKEVFSLFFVLAGTHLDFGAIKVAGIAGIILILSRGIGKTFAPSLGAFLGRSTKVIKKNIGFALYPIAGLAIGLVLLCQNIPFLKEYASQITAIVLTAVVVNELIGPIFTGLAIKRAGEEHKNRMRLMDFLQEEFIKIDLDVKDKWQALDEMAEFLYKTHKIHELTLEELKKSLINREKDFSTGLGENLAIPHAMIEGGPKIRGVIGISKKGIDFDSLDDKLVNIIFLIATPKEHYNLHLYLLANIAKIFSHHPHIKEKILLSNSSAEVYDIFQREEVEQLNPFFEN